MVNTTSQLKQVYVLGLDVCFDLLFKSVSFYAPPRFFFLIMWGAVPMEARKRSGDPGVRNGYRSPV